MPTARSFLGTARSLYRSVFHQAEDSRIRGVADTLRACPAFQQLSRSELRDLAQVLHPREYSRHELLYYEDDPGLGLYIVQTGRVRLFILDEDDMEHEVCQVGEGEIFGVVSILGLGELRRMETAQAVTNTRVLGFFSPDLRTMLRRNPKTAAAILLALARYLALRQMDMVKRIADTDGRVAAMQIFGSAAYQPHVPAQE